MTDATQQDLLDQIEALKAQLVKPSPPEQKYETYAVRPGDSLWKIATKYYGDGAKWPRIYDENRKVIGDNPDLIHPGQKYRIPLEEK